MKDVEEMDADRELLAVVRVVTASGWLRGRKDVNTSIAIGCKWLSKGPRSGRSKVQAKESNVTPSGDEGGRASSRLE